MFFFSEILQIHCFLNKASLIPKSAVTGEMSHFVASHLGLHCLIVPCVWKARLKFPMSPNFFKHYLSATIKTCFCCNYLVLLFFFFKDVLSNRGQQLTPKPLLAKHEGLTFSVLDKS